MIIKRGVGAIVFSLLALSPGLVYQAEARGDLKIGYVHLEGVAGRYAKTQKLKKALEKEAQAKQKEIDKMTKQIEKLERELKTKAPGLKEEERNRRAEIIKEKITEWRKLFREYDLEIKNKNYEQEMGLRKEIDEVVRSYGKEKSYTLILDGRTIIYGLKGLDLTDEIVKILNTAQ